MHSGNGSANSLNGLVGSKELQDMFLPLILQAYSQRGYAVRLVTVKAGKEDILETNPLNGRVEQLTLENLVVAPEAPERLEQGHEYLAYDQPLQYNVVGKVFVGFHGFIRPDYGLSVVVEFRGLKLDASHIKVGETEIGVRDVSDDRFKGLCFFDYLSAIENWLPEACAANARRRNGSNRQG